MCSSHGKRHGCKCPSAKPNTKPITKMERFAEPCLLLLLAEQPSHGYELMERMVTNGLMGEAPDAALVYRTLRKLEEQGIVSSTWDTDSAGPARRLYALTEDGRDYLSSWRHQVENNLKRLQHFLERYNQIIEE